MAINNPTRMFYAQTMYNITNDAIGARTTHADNCHWMAINNPTGMFYTQTMYFRYIRTAKYYGQSEDCPLVILSPQVPTKRLFAHPSPCPL
jgi:hypothetical protein